MAQRGQKFSDVLNSKSSAALSALKRLRISGRIGSLSGAQQMMLRSSGKRSRVILAHRFFDPAEVRQGAWSLSIWGECHAC